MRLMLMIVAGLLVVCAATVLSSQPFRSWYGDTELAALDEDVLVAGQLLLYPSLVIGDYVLTVTSDTEITMVTARADPYTTGKLLAHKKPDAQNQVDIKVKDSDASVWILVECATVVTARLEQAP